MFLRVTLRKYPLEKHRSGLQEVGAVFQQVLLAGTYEITVCDVAQIILRAYYFPV